MDKFMEDYPSNVILTDGLTIKEKEHIDLSYKAMLRNKDKLKLDKFSY
jgi:hypothetical protein